MCKFAKRLALSVLLLAVPGVAQLTGGSAGPGWREQLGGSLPYFTSFGVGTDGDMWALDKNKPATGGYNVVHYNKSTNNWDSMNGAGSQIVVLNSSHVYVLNNQHNVYYTVDGAHTWNQLPSINAVQISVGSDASVAARTTTPLGCGYDIQVLVAGSSSWQDTGLGFSMVSIVNRNSIWGMCTSIAYPKVNVFHWTPQTGITQPNSSPCCPGSGWLNYINVDYDNTTVWGASPYNNNDKLNAGGQQAVWMAAIPAANGKANWLPLQNVPGGAAVGIVGPTRLPPGPSPVGYNDFAVTGSGRVWQFVNDVTGPNQIVDFGTLNALSPPSSGWTPNFDYLVFGTLCCGGGGPSYQLYGKSIPNGFVDQYEPQTISPGSQVQCQFRFYPSAPGTYSGTITLDYIPTTSGFSQHLILTIRVSGTWTP